MPFHKLGSLTERTVSGRLTVSQMRAQMYRLDGKRCQLEIGSRIQ